jgi:hypothetical protein
MYFIIALLARWLGCRSTVALLDLARRAQQDQGLFGGNWVESSEGIADMNNDKLTGPYIRYQGHIDSFHDIAHTHPSLVVCQ